MEYTGFAYFVKRPRRLEDLTVPHLVERERPYRIVAEVQLSAVDYENFVTDMLADRQFIKGHGRSCKKSKVWSCLLVRRRSRPDGVLVMPEGGCFVGWAACCSGLYIPIATASFNERRTQICFDYLLKYALSLL